MSMREITLSRGKVALVDDEDYDRVNALKWHWHPGNTSHVKNGGQVPTGYANRRHKSGGPTTPMHRFILGLTDLDGIDNSPDIEVDHINGDGLDNRRHNLRACTRAQNSHNSKPIRGVFKGVFQRNNGKSWRAAIRVNDRLLCLGTYTTPEMAAAAYNKAAREYFGEFAYLNSVPDVELVRLPPHGRRRR